LSLAPISLALNWRQRGLPGADVVEHLIVSHRTRIVMSGQEAARLECPTCCGGSLGQAARFSLTEFLLEKEPTSDERS